MSMSQILYYCEEKLINIQRQVIFNINLLIKQFFYDFIYSHYDSKGLLSVVINITV